MQESSFRLPSDLLTEASASRPLPGLRRALLEMARTNPGGRGFDNKMAFEDERPALRRHNGW
ncbi:hypothetical protein [Actinomadura opuntiae]|uniref:hypothetical protein n=1 Tax=Actinomadura sp. OS1-43 TaxID=604315 RepID=UPI00255ACBB7|nr:hypothetical protein [Actinomadura sp. OS1-43]MDL4814584.1 hypothetical protein [Actinomadura sp. OS1-43]